jgi:MFS family permease
MLFRFSLYGFLKNQRYFEPFLILALRDKGLSFLQIGVLLGFREVWVNLFEIPSGAVADLYGRRRAMTVSFSAYIVSLATFAMSRNVAWLFAAMFSYAVGDAFRSGTHKAMIFDWLRSQGRSDENTRVYGYTRSWSKIGSAVSVVLAAGLVFYTGGYTHIFWFAIIPYALNIVNFLGYPAALDGKQDGPVTFAALFGALRQSLREVAGHRPLRRAVLEALGFEGVFHATKDYLQPLLKQVAIGLPVLLFASDLKRTAVLVGVVYFVLHIMSSVAARQAHRVVDAAGGEDAATNVLWRVDWFLFAGLLASLVLGWQAPAIAAFVLLMVLQNLWRPALVSRINTHSTPELGATVLSIEAQAKSLATMVLAPSIGWAVDATGSFWPVAAAGFAAATGGLLLRATSSRPTGA